MLAVVPSADEVLVVRSCRHRRGRRPGSLIMTLDATF
jgi:hypothetical protein